MKRVLVWLTLGCLAVASVLALMFTVVFGAGTYLVAVSKFSFWPLALAGFILLMALIYRAMQITCNAATRLIMTIVVVDEKLRLFAQFPIANLSSKGVTYVQPTERGHQKVHSGLAVLPLPKAKRKTKRSKRKGSSGDTQASGK